VTSRPLLLAVISIVVFILVAVMIVLGAQALLS
jgi:hypothetical protein